MAGVADALAATATTATAKNFGGGLDKGSPPVYA
jgi:hypothetical protein